MISYASLAGSYDKLMRDVDYAAVAYFYETEINKCGKVSSVLDAACGTGTVSAILAEHGYDVIAADISPEMLAVAWEKLGSVECKTQPLLLNQSITELDLYGTVDAAICTIDGMNYISPEEIADAFARIFLFLEPGGVFAFDMNSPEKFSEMDGKTYFDEAGDTCCVWRTEIDEEEQTCIYAVDIFTRIEGDTWKRESEEHEEYIYSEEIIEKILKKTGFEGIEVKPAPWETGANGEIYRFCFSARKPGIFHKN